MMPTLVTSQRKGDEDYFLNIIHVYHKVLRSRVAFPRSENMASSSRLVPGFMDTDMQDGGPTLGSQEVFEFVVSFFFVFLPGLSKYSAISIFRFCNFFLRTKKGTVRSTRL